jgi:hypothetical protein
MTPRPLDRTAEIAAPADPTAPAAFGVVAGGNARPDPALEIGLLCRTLAGAACSDPIYRVGDAAGPAEAGHYEQRPRGVRRSKIGSVRECPWRDPGNVPVAQSDSKLNWFSQS